jgi:hypothetical protein
MDRLELPVEIDFDAASVEWRKNKKAKSDGSFEYVCGVVREHCANRYL